MLNYEISGNGREKLVLLHGFMENLTVWHDMAKSLSPDFTLIKIDLPGHGLSPVSAEIHSMEFMAEEVKKVTDHLELPSFHLLGHSMGGYVSLSFAENYGEVLQSITLFFSTYFADDDEKREQRRKSLQIIKESFPAYVNGGIPNLFNANEKDILEGKIAHAKEIALRTPVAGVTAAIKGMMARTEKSDVLADFEGKILVLAGKHDNAVNSEKTLQNLPEKTNIKSYFLDCGHNGQWEKPTICAEVINTELLHNLPKRLVF